MRRIVAVSAILVCAVSVLSGCCLGTFWWDGANNRSYNFDLGKVGTGEQSIYSPNDKQPWQGDAVEKKHGL